MKKLFSKKKNTLEDKNLAAKAQQVSVPVVKPQEEKTYSTDEWKSLIKIETSKLSKTNTVVF